VPLVVGEVARLDATARQEPERPERGASRTRRVPNAARPLALRFASARLSSRVLASSVARFVVVTVASPSSQLCPLRALSQGHSCPKVPTSVPRILPVLAGDTGKNAGIMGSLRLGEIQFNPISPTLRNPGIPGFFWFSVESSAIYVPSHFRLPDAQYGDCRRHLWGDRQEPHGLIGVDDRGHRRTRSCHRVICVVAHRASLGD